MDTVFGAHGVYMAPRKETVMSESVTFPAKVSCQEALELGLVPSSSWFWKVVYKRSPSRAPYDIDRTAGRYLAFLRGRRGIETWPHIKA